MTVNAKYTLVRATGAEAEANTAAVLLVVFLESEARHNVHRLQFLEEQFARIRHLHCRYTG